MRITLLLALMCFSVLVKAHNPRLAEAQKLYHEGKYEAAIRILNEILEGDDDGFEALRMRGDCYQKDEKFVAAIQSYEQAQKLNSQSALLHTNHGAAFLNLKQYREAEKKFKQAIKLDPTLPEAHYFLGNLKYFEFSTMAALKHYNEAIKLNPKYRDALYMRGAAHAEMGQYKQALEDYENALAVDPTLGMARYNIAVIHLQNDDYQKAAAMLKDVHPGDLPKEADYYYSLGEALYFGGEREAACEAYEQAMNLGDEESKKIYLRYCVDKEQRDELLRTRTIRMAF